MSGARDNLVLEVLRALRAGQERIEHVLREHSPRLTAVKMALLSLRHEWANDA